LSGQQAEPAGEVELVTDREMIRQFLVGKPLLVNQLSGEFDHEPAVITLPKWEAAEGCLTISLVALIAAECRLIHGLPTESTRSAPGLRAGAIGIPKGTFFCRHPAA